MRRTVAHALNVAYIRVEHRNSLQDWQQLRSIHRPAVKSRPGEIQWDLIDPGYTASYALARDDQLPVLCAVELQVVAHHLHPHGSPHGLWETFVHQVPHPFHPASAASCQPARTHMAHVHVVMRFLHAVSALDIRVFLDARIFFETLSGHGDVVSTGDLHRS